MDRHGLNFVYLGTAIMTVMQGLNMLNACCLGFDAHLIILSTLVTVVCTIPIILGFSQIVEEQQSDSKEGEGKCGADVSDPND